MKPQPFGATPDSPKGSFVYIHQVPIALALRMDSPSSRFFNITAGRKSICNIGRIEDEQFVDIFRFGPDTPDTPYFAAVMQFPSDDGRNTITFNIISRVNGIVHPAIFGGEFIKWGYNLFLKKLGRIDAIVANWLDKPDQTNTAMYKAGLKATKGNRVLAAQTTWTAARFAELGFPKVSLVGEADSSFFQTMFAADGQPNQVMVTFEKETYNGQPIIRTSNWGDAASK